MYTTIILKICSKYIKRSTSTHLNRQSGDILEILFMYEDISEKVQKEAKRYMDFLTDELNSKFKKYNGLKYNPNTKGSDYEKVISNILIDYFSTRFDIHTRAQVVDAGMRYLGIFQNGENEFDIVSTFKTAIPKLIIKSEQTNFIPYDAVGFVMEVKSQMNKQSLESDLDKLGKLSKLEVTPWRFNLVTGSPFKIERPLKILFYFEKSIEQDTMESLLKKYIRVWDAIFVLNPNKSNTIAIVNASLPFLKAVGNIAELADQVNITGPYYEMENVPFIIFLIFIAISTPEPLTVDLSAFFMSLAILSENKKQSQ